MTPKTLKKQKKNLQFTGFELRTFGSKGKSYPSEPRRLLIYKESKKLTNQYTYDTVLANFSQFAPLCATLDLYSPNLDLFAPLFCLYNFPVVSGSLFQNLDFG